MFILLYVILALFALTFLVMSQAKFGKRPQGERLEKIKKSPNYKNGAFQNQSPTPALTEGSSYLAVIKTVFFEKKVRVTPQDEIPAIKTDLLNLDPDAAVLVWFGHSSYFLQVDGKRILVDPVFSGAASPFSFTTKAFKGADRYTPEDFPAIDYLFITHDHWDHLDHATLVKLKPKIKKVICSLGTGEHLEHWGYAPEKLIEKDWNETIDLGNGFRAHTVATRHFSGRGFKRNQALWTSYVLQTPTMKLFLGGDSGYDQHFAEIGKEFGPFDLVMLENGQYNKHWKYIHMTPEEVLQAAEDLQAKRVFPVHSSKFALSNHPWDDPLARITSLPAQIPVITPMIGESVQLRDAAQRFSAWWKEIR
jgi:L-ascorbate metabolism protein UlaG (beta-lactamase superfamily)